MHAISLDVHYGKFLSGQLVCNIKLRCIVVPWAACTLLNTNLFGPFLTTEPENELIRQCYISESMFLEQLYPISDGLGMLLCAIVARKRGMRHTNL